jgi:hypothetical protein
MYKLFFAMAANEQISFSAIPIFRLKASLIAMIREIFLMTISLADEPVCMAPQQR